VENEEDSAADEVTLVPPDSVDSLIVSIIDKDEVEDVELLVALFPLSPPLSWAAEAAAATIVFCRLRRV